MNGAYLLMFLFVGALAGWLGSLVVKGDGRALIGDLVVGVAGALFGGWLFNNDHPTFGNVFVGSLIGAGLGAVILLFVLWLVRRAGFAR